MTLAEIQREYCRKSFIFCAFDYKSGKSKPTIYADLLTMRLKHMLVSTNICSNIHITFDETLWATEPIYKNEYRDNQLTRLFGGKIPETNYQNIVRLTYMLSKDMYDHRSIIIDLRQSYNELINTEFYVD